jgi:hypothetical protein
MRNSLIYIKKISVRCGDNRRRPTICAAAARSHLAGAPL